MSRRAPLEENKMRKEWKFSLLSLVLLVSLAAGCASLGGGGSSIQINLDVQKTGHDIANTMYGVFYEDINYAADGGMYPELVRNRSFEFITPDARPRNLSGWVANYKELGEGEVSPSKESPLFQTNPTYVTVDIKRGPYVIINRGYAAVPDMPIASGAEYNFYFYIRNKGYSGSIICSLEDGNGKALANTITVSPDSSGWKKYGPFVFTATSGGMALLSLRCEGTGRFDLDYVSLMPTDTWGYGKSEWPYGGLRKDLVQALADLNPGFIRFPGGCIVEGAFRHETAYQWKNTIGEPEKRKENSNLWGYMMSYGLGYHEYFQLCEDLGAEPVPVIYAGILCQARNDGTNTEPDYRPGSPEFNQLIQDYLDLIEYANGNATSAWGAKRAANGHPAPFNLKMLGIGNENWEANYWQNFKEIRAAILKAYPSMKIITTTGPLSDGWINDQAWTQINSFYKDAIVDEHYYKEPSWFLYNTRRYDSYRRNGIQIFVGEYAAHETNRANTWYSALCEASYMTSLERNADIVVMASYAPLFAREQNFQWMPDMIWFDSGKITNLTPNYQIQKFFSANTGTKTLPPEKIPATGALFHASSVDRGKGFIYTKLVNPYSKGKTITVNYANANIAEAALTMLSGSQTDREVKAEESAITVSDNSITITLEPYSTAIVRLKNAE
jgi:alpha-L-arabinofuranosidase